MARFIADAYARYRAIYPSQLKDLLVSHYERVHSSTREEADRLAIVDVGCGSVGS